MNRLRPLFATPARLLQCPPAMQTSLLSTPAFSRLLDLTLNPWTASACRPAAAHSTPARPVDLFETGDGFVLRLELTGVAPEDLDLQVEGRQLTLRWSQPGRRTAEPAPVATSPADAADAAAAEAPAHAEPAPADTRPHQRRVLRLPDGVDSTAIQAQLRHGILELRLPKAASAQRRQIEVR